MINFAEAEERAKEAIAKRIKGLQAAIDTTFKKLNEMKCEFKIQKLCTAFIHQCLMIRTNDKGPLFVAS